VDTEKLRSLREAYIKDCNSLGKNDLGLGLLEIELAASALDTDGEEEEDCDVDEKEEEDGHDDDDEEEVEEEEDEIDEDDVSSGCKSLEAAKLDNEDVELSTSGGDPTATIPQSPGDLGVAAIAAFQFMTNTATHDSRRTTQSLRPDGSASLIRNQQWEEEMKAMPTGPTNGGRCITTEAPSAPCSSQLPSFDATRVEEVADKLGSLSLSPSPSKPSSRSTTLLQLERHQSHSRNAITDATRAELLEKLFNQKGDSSGTSRRPLIEEL